LLEEARTYTKELAARFRIHVLDFSIPANFGGTDEHWFDGAHMDDSNAELVAKRLAAVIGAKQ
jgi:lysophospholipase L1-like esterase